jgi:hypothetical protein
MPQFLKYTRLTHDSPYLKPGRLADVIAALQVMASAKRPEREIRDWAKVLDGAVNQDTIGKWTHVFSEHREFFLTYRLSEKSELKAALRWRYALKNFDSEAGKELTQAEIDQLPQTARDLLTTRPLGGDQVETLLNTAISLRTRALEELVASRWWVNVLIAILAALGAIAGTLLSGYFGLHK